MNAPSIEIWEMCREKVNSYIPPVAPMALVGRAPAQLNAHGLPREARARLGRLLGVVLSKINLEPRLQPGLFLSASQARVREIGHPPKGFDILSGHPTP